MHNSKELSFNRITKITWAWPITNVIWPAADFIAKR